MKIPRVAPVTGAGAGAGSGIGRATALELARRGDRIGLLSHTPGDLDVRIEPIRKLGGDAIALPAGEPMTGRDVFRGSADAGTASPRISNGRGTGWPIRMGGRAPTSEETTMKLTSLSLAAILAFGGIAMAQTTPPMPSADTAAAPLTSGANSFTEDQARERIVEAGYTDVTGLVKGEDGIWRGHARRDGATGVVGVDYKGTVATTTTTTAP